jgi:ferric-dicitrate binding protein FerR (iron transport regulator)
MSECPVSKRLSEYAVGPRKGRAASRVARHLATCAACRLELAALERTGALLDSLSLADAPEGTWDRIAARLAPSPVRARLRYAFGFAAAVVALALVALGLLAIRRTGAPTPPVGGGQVVAADVEMETTMEGHLATTWGAPLADEAAMGLRLASLEDDG